MYRKKVFLFLTFILAVAFQGFADTDKKESTAELGQRLVEEL